MARQWTRRIAGATLAAMMLAPALLGASPAEAQDHRDGFRRPPLERRWSRPPDRPLHRQDQYRWRGGSWVHGRHAGRFGWWWVVGPSWYFYTAPVYPYPAYIPPVAAPLPPQPPATAWYYCGSAQAYYPYVGSCPEGWIAVPPAPAF